MRNVAIIAQPVIQQYVPPPMQEVTNFSSIDWSLVSELDPDVIRRNKDSSKIKDFIFAFKTFTINQTDTKTFTNPLAARLFCLIQVAFDYQQHLQHQFTKLIQKKDAKYNRLSKKCKILEESYQKSKELIESLRGNHETCPVCQRRFKGTVYLDNHFRRKHPDLVPAWNAIRTQTPIQQPDVEALLKEIKELKDAQQNVPYIIQNPPQVVTYHPPQQKQEIPQPKIQTQPISTVKSEESINPFAVFQTSDHSSSVDEQNFVRNKTDSLEKRQIIQQPEKPQPTVVVKPTKIESDSDDLGMPEIDKQEENLAPPKPDVALQPLRRKQNTPPPSPEPQKPKNQIATLNKARNFVDKEKSVKGNMNTSEFEREIEIASENIRRQVAERLKKDPPQKFTKQQNDEQNYEQKPQISQQKSQNNDKNSQQSYEQKPIEKKQQVVQKEEDLEDGEFSYESNPFETDYDQDENSFAIEQFLAEEEEMGEIQEEDNDDNPFLMDNSNISHENPFTVDNSNLSRENPFTVDNSNVSAENPFMMESSSGYIPQTQPYQPPKQPITNFVSSNNSISQQQTKDYRGIEVSSGLFDDESSTFIQEKEKLLPPQQKKQMAPPPKRRLLEITPPMHDEPPQKQPQPQPNGLMPRPAGIARAEAARQENPKLRGFFTENDFLDD